MRSNPMGVVIAVIAIALAAGAYYYWTGGGSNDAVTGVVLEKFQREPGTEAGGKVLEQGVRLMSGRSLEQDIFYFVRVETEDGEQLELEVPRDLYLKVKPGDTVSRPSHDAEPTIMTQSAPR